MNEPMQPLVLPVIDSAVLQRARLLASQSHRSVVDELESLIAVDPRVLIQAIAAPFQLQIIETVDMFEMTPAFDLLSLSKAMQRNCVLLKTNDHKLIGVIADPFDADLQTLLDTLAHDTVEFRLALRIDIQAYLTKLEETVRAVDNIEQTAQENRRDSKSIETLSYASVSEGSSPAVKLVKIGRAHV